MSYRSSINQRNLLQTLFQNTSIVTDTTNPNAPATVAYVNSEVDPLITEVQDLQQLTTSLQNNITALQTQANTIQSSIIRTIGSIIMVMSPTVPPYTLLCNGTLYSTTAYPELFAVIGYNYGGSGTQFAVPNFQSYFPVGGNSNVNGVAVSNIMTGNGQPSAINTYSVTGAPWTALGASQPTFPIINRAPPHSHNINDPGHSHYVSDTGYTNLPVAGTTPFLSTDSTFGRIDTQSAKTGISIQTAGTNILQKDPNSDIQGINVTPPYIACNFFICYN
jgi:microcystin-dependent protein